MATYFLAFFMALTLLISLIKNHIIHKKKKYDINYSFLVCQALWRPRMFCRRRTVYMLDSMWQADDTLSPRYCRTLTLPLIIYMRSKEQFTRQRCCCCKTDSAARRRRWWWLQCGAADMVIQRWKN